MRLFDRKFGADFLAGVPAGPGVYRFLDAAGTVLYVGKAASLRRRLGQYRAAGRRARDRKRRSLVRTAARLEWQSAESALAAGLAELRLIQALRPPANVAGAYAFLYPFLGLRVDGGETYLCLTTSPAAFPGFELHGAFRSRAVTRAAFFALARLLRFLGHPVPPRRCRRLVAARHSHVRGFRRLPPGTARAWSRLFRGESGEALEELALALLEHPGARARAGQTEDDLRAIGRFFRAEARALARARRRAGFAAYPVPQAERDPLFLRAAAGRALSRSGPGRSRPRPLPR